MERITIIGMLDDETSRKRQKHCRRVLSPIGIAPCIPAGCGMGGGITPKIMESYETDGDTETGTERGGEKA